MKTLITLCLVLCGCLISLHGQVVDCNGMVFTDVTSAVGITHKYNHPGLSGHPMAGGAVAEDFNNDGWLDLYVVQGSGGPNLLYINNQAGGFVDEAAIRGADLQVSAAGASAADYDNDGDVDIAVSVHFGQPIVLVNDGTGHFTSQILLPNPLEITMGSSWGDVDNDGLLELAIGQWNPADDASGQSLFLYKNLGGGILSSYEFRSTPAEDRSVFAPRFADVNGDRLSDLHVAADFARSQLYLNTGNGMFANVTTSSGVGKGKNDMGHAIGDYDNDGDLDTFTSDISTHGGNRLYNNNGTGIFTQVQETAGVVDGAWGWGASFGDLDNDGDLDLYHVNGWISPGWIDTPARLFMNDGNGIFTEVAGCAGADDSGQGRGMLFFDFDNDGDLDIFIVNNRDMEAFGDDFPGTPVLLRNDTSNGNHWLKVTLDGSPPMHHHGIGSRVYVQVGDLRQMRELDASSNYLSQNPGRIAHFGLGAALSAIEVRAEWVTGDSTVLANVDANQSISIPSPVATVTKRLVTLAESVIASAAGEPNPKEWEIEGVLYADPVSISFETPGVKELNLLVYDIDETTLIRKEVLWLNVTAPEITSPVPGSVLPGGTVTFDWTANGSTVTDWQLHVGSAEGQSDLFDSGILTGTTLSASVTGLPADGSAVYARLFYTIDGATSYSDHQYTASGGATGMPEIVSPAPGSVLPGDTVTFDWTANGAPVSSWRLWVGTTPGGSDLHSAILGAGTLSRTVTGLPTDGSTVYVKLSWKIDGGVPDNADYQYTGGVVPTITSPLPGSVLPGDTVTFDWTANGLPVTDWQLHVGSAEGQSDLFDSGILTSTTVSALVSGLPTDGSAVYARLFYTIDGATTFSDHQYTASGGATGMPEIVSPVPGSVFASHSETFEWTANGTSIFAWQFSVGTTPGGSDLHGEITGAGTLSRTVTGLPVDGSTIHVRLSWKTQRGGPTMSIDYQYTAKPWSIARIWNEELLHAIRKDFARPTVHARNLAHVSMAIYDAWAAYDTTAQTVLHHESANAADVAAARAETISFAAYRVLKSRFATSPGAAETLPSFDARMLDLGYDINDTSTDGPSPAALGNRIAATFLAFGDNDGSNESNGYANQYYVPVNPALLPALPGNPDIIFPNRWQPLALDFFIDQSGNLIIGGVPPFLSPEWGQVTPFALTDEDLTVYNRDGFDYLVYHDPGPPPLIGTATEDYYKWGFEMVSVWSSHLDPSDGVMIDISPRSIGNSPLAGPGEFEVFYDFENGGDWGTGYAVNPVTGQEYVQQIVPRGDYTRVLAEFWADGPDSETPPGHWFSIANYVSDHPLLVKRLGGAGIELNDLEWDVKLYLTLGGAMHDCAIAAWGVKGWYDYLRPVSAIRYMADRGQSTDPLLPSYDEAGINLHPGLIELVSTETTFPGQRHEHLAGSEGKIAILAWRGPEFINDPAADVAGVGWILAENWWPYQRPSFVTPPFAGYVSGHSTYSRAGAVVLSLFTGSPYFPGGLGEFHCPQNEFLVFEDGPSVDLTLQWASYQDASDQTSLSRIWGGIHPPADDLPGRHMGQQIGEDAFALANLFFGGN